MKIKQFTVKIKKKYERYRRQIFLVTAGVVVILGLISFLSWTSFSSFQKELKLSVSIDEYMNAQAKQTPLISRGWMNVVMDIVKEKKYTPAVSARLYAYTASVFSDVLSATNDTEEASTATAEILNVLESESSEEVGAFLKSLDLHSRSLSPTAVQILSQYETRAKNDGFDTVWDPNAIPENPDAWYLRTKYHIGSGMESPDTGAMSGEWTPWIVTESPIEIPPPPARKTLEDTVDVQSVVYATEHRKTDDLKRILFWDGIENFYNQNKSRSISEAGIWQNIFFVEKGSNMTEAEYAGAQKFLAQSLADAAMYSWKTKYGYYRQRPSMRIENLNSATTDQVSPGYVSDHAAIAASAATVLSGLFPESVDTWHLIAKDAAWSQLISGANFKSDIDEGLLYGEAIGSAILTKLDIKTFRGTNYTQPSFTDNIDLWIGLTMANLVNDLKPEKIWIEVQAWSSRMSFEEMSVQAKLNVSESRVAAWGDYNNDGFLDLLAGGRLFKNNGDDTFINVTGNARLTDKLDGVSGFSDINNDGCPDIVKALNGHMVYYRSDCKGAFASSEKFISTGFGDKVRGLAFADYDNDGDVDIYTSAAYSAAYFVTPNSPQNTQDFSQPNVLWKNDSKGGFTDVTLKAGVRGTARCSKFTLQKSLDISVTTSYQPVWFDYNNDNLPDLYIATDSGISPLYKNNGDGTFTDVTEVAGLCKPGTGMGVAIADLDNNGYLDIYVTNVGSNYLWMNYAGIFTEEALERKATDQNIGWGTVLSDFDNDGDLDLYVANSAIPSEEFSAEKFLSNLFDFNNFDLLLENDGTGHFHPVTEHAGLGDSYLKHSAAVADYDNDGRMDLYIGASGHPVGIYNSLYHNTSQTGNHWISLRLKGTTSNSEGVGAVVTVVSGGKSYMQQLIQGSSFFSENSPWLHFGLGKSRTIDSITIRWPSGKVQTLTNVEVDKIVEVTEP